MAAPSLKISSLALILLGLMSITCRISAQQQVCSNISNSIPEQFRETRVVGISLDDEGASAILEHANGSQSVYDIGDKISDDSVLVRIEPKRLLVNHRGICVCLYMVGGTRGQSQYFEPVRVAGEKLFGALYGGDNIAPSISEASIHLPLQDIEPYLGSGSSIRGTDNVSYYINQGQILGIVPDEIDPQSFFGKIGLRNGDIIGEIGGQQITGVISASIASRQIRNGPVSVTYERDGTIHRLKVDAF